MGCWSVRATRWLLCQLREISCSQNSFCGPACFWNITFPACAPPASNILNCSAMKDSAKVNKRVWMNFTLSRHKKTFLTMSIHPFWKPLIHFRAPQVMFTRNSLTITVFYQCCDTFLFYTDDTAPRIMILIINTRKIHFPECILSVGSSILMPILPVVV